MATTPGHFLSGKRIIVAGGGIAGSTFVSALDQLWDPFLPRPQITVLERETREASIEQDHYMLSINGGHVDEGLAALKYLGLLDDVRAGATLNSGAIWVWSDTWKLLSSINLELFERVLLEKAEKAEKCTWQWACTVIGAEQLPNGQIRVTISNNAIPSSTSSTLSQDCDLLIAADGADSRIKANLRPQDLKLEYAGASQIGGISHFPNGVPHPVHEDYGLQMSSGEGVCCIYTPFDNYTVGWALSKMGPERAAKTTFTIEEFTALKEEALKFGSIGKFAEPFNSIVETTDPTTAFIRLAKE
ncbi:uncharacterized protein PAC_02453 [Phialocephala subalpina]|uniref:FAD-binding domain-containing protein n=1 Tax=Phialocephala subalpina TaxID=576137 RepID=A0A1L7WII5_9HELO|nr:uncharacterized protein PAC_02453 [Phialocephala subalpina]